MEPFKKSSKISTNLSNPLLLKALNLEKTTRTPIWMMRQAGRYLPEYRNIRAKIKNFLTLCKTPSLAAEVTLQPMERFQLDAAIIFSDILTIPDAMGLGLYFKEKEGPSFKNPVRSLLQVQRLPIVDPELELGYVMDAIRLCKKSINGAYPIIGFAGSPFTVACYMVEGGGSKTFNLTRKMLYETPEILSQLIAKMTQNTILYLLAQIEAGADCLMLFDTWGGLLPRDEYLTFSLKPMQSIVHAIKERHPKVPMTLFSKNGGKYVKAQAKTGCHALGLDWNADLKSVIKKVGHQVALQGNLDPAVLYGAPDLIQQKVRTIMRAFSGVPGHVFNLGHGIYPDIPIEHVHCLVNTVRTFQIDR